MMLINLIKGNFRHLSKSLGCPKPDYDVNLNIGRYYMQLGTRNMKHRKIGKQIILTFNSQYLLTKVEGWYYTPFFQFSTPFYLIFYYIQVHSSQIDRCMGVKRFCLLVGSSTRQQQVIILCSLIKWVSDRSVNKKIKKSSHQQHRFVLRDG